MVLVERLRKDDRRDQRNAIYLALSQPRFTRHSDPMDVHDTKPQKKAHMIAMLISLIPIKQKVLKILDYNI